MEHPVLGAVAKLRKATIRFYMSARPSVRPSVRMPFCPPGTLRLSLDGF